jgi:hypothetical protein
MYFFTRPISDTELLSHEDPGHAGHGPVAAYEHRRAIGRVAAFVPFPDRPHVASPPRPRIRMP